MVFLTVPLVYGGFVILLSENPRHFIFQHSTAALKCLNSDFFSLFKTSERIQASLSPFVPAPPAPAAPRLAPAHAAELRTASPHGKGSSARGRTPDGSPGGAAASREAAKPHRSGAPSAFCCRRGSPLRYGRSRSRPSPRPRQVMGTSGCDNTPPIFPCIEVSVTNRGNARKERGRRERKARTQ